MAEDELTDTTAEGALEPRELVRFSIRQRVEHLVVMCLFSALLLTGLPQKYFQSGWGEWLILQMGGIAAVRILHRFLGIAFAAAAVFHLAFALYGFFAAGKGATILPNRKDGADAILMLKYCLGLTQEEPLFDRFDYRQKFEYWGLLFGGIIMIITGFILYFPSVGTLFLPGQVVPAAKVAHSQEALLAFLVVIIWHMYGAHFHPGIFPLDSSIFTGKISRERMIEEHPLEYARLAGLNPEELKHERGRGAIDEMKEKVE